MKRLHLISLLIAVLLCGCANTAQPPQRAGVQHIVVVWLREPGNVAQREQLVAASQQLTQIPGVISVQGGSVIADNRPVVDSTFDVALVFNLRDRETLREYVKHPLHQKLLREVFQPLIERYRVYDVEQRLFDQ